MLPSTLNFWKLYYGQLKGATIKDVRVEDDGTPVLTIKFAGEEFSREVGILRDPEGNGPGFLDNLPEVKK